MPASILSWDNVPDFERVHTAIAAYRVAQEALTNVARHSGATERGGGPYRLQKTPPYTWSVVDNGKRIWSLNKLDRDARPWALRACASAQPWPAGELGITFTSRAWHRDKRLSSCPYCMPGSGDLHVIKVLLADDHSALCGPG